MSEERRQELVEEVERLLCEMLAAHENASRLETQYVVSGDKVQGYPIKQPKTSTPKTNREVDEACEKYKEADRKWREALDALAAYTKAQRTP